MPKSVFFKTSCFQVTDDLRWCSQGVIANMLDYDIVVPEFELQSCYYVHFVAKILGEGMNAYFDSYGLNITNTVFHKDNFGII